MGAHTVEPLEPGAGVNDIVRAHLVHRRDVGMPVCVQHYHGGRYSSNRQIRFLQSVQPEPPLVHADSCGVHHLRP
jgi:hypothetical protein